MFAGLTVEDNLYLDRGQLATNADLSGRAKQILESMNYTVLGPEAVRDKLQLQKRTP